MPEIKMGSKLNFLLMGKTGQGKSSTGNSILDRRIFKTAFNTTSQTKDVEFSFAEFQQCILLVVDGPGLEDADMTTVEDKERAVTSMDTALAMCYGGVDAFLFVIKFGSRFIAEDKNALESLKRILGDSYFDHLVVVITGGDFFQLAMEEEDSNYSFEEWCRKQTGQFRQLYDDCQGRVVLFNNKEKNEEKKQKQRQHLVQLAYDLKARNGRYTSECFQIAKAEREKLILEQKAPILREEIQKQISLLTADLNKLSEVSSKSDIDKVRQRLKDLKDEIDAQDKGYGLLNDVVKLVKKVEHNLDNFDQLQQLAYELEDARKVKAMWSKMGIICSLAGGVIGLATPFVGAVVCIASIVSTFAGRTQIYNKEKYIEENVTKIKKQSKTDKESVTNN